MDTTRIAKLLRLALGNENRAEADSAIRQALVLLQKQEEVVPFDDEGWRRECTWRSAKGGGWYAHVDDTRVFVGRNSLGPTWFYSIDGKTSQERFRTADDAKRAAEEVIGL